MVVFPAASSPTINILISFFPNRLLNKLAKAPIFALYSCALDWAVFTLYSNKRALPTTSSTQTGAYQNQPPQITQRHMCRVASFRSRGRGSYIIAPARVVGAKLQIWKLKIANSIHPTFGNELYLACRHSQLLPLCWCALNKNKHLQGTCSVQGQVLYVRAGQCCSSDEENCWEWRWMSTDTGEGVEYLGSTRSGFVSHL